MTGARELGFSGSGLRLLRRRIGTRRSRGKRKGFMCVIGLRFTCLRLGTAGSDLQNDPLLLWVWALATRVYTC
jgi:hypothetical protein